MPADPTTLLQLEVPIIVQLAERQMHVREVIGLVPGTILDLEKSAENELDLLVNNRLIGQGTAVKIGENFGVRVTFVGDPADRVEAVTAPEAEDDSTSRELSPEELAEAMLAGDV